MFVLRNRGRKAVLWEGNTIGFAGFINLLTLREREIEVGLFIAAVIEAITCFLDVPQNCK